jgi:hypothetical protein
VIQGSNLLLTSGLIADVVTKKIRCDVRDTIELREVWSPSEDLVRQAQQLLYHTIVEPRILKGRKENNKRTIRWMRAY